MIVLVDSREQAPFPFIRFNVQAERAGLPTGDYSLPGFEDKAAIERKSLDDLVSCLMGKNRDRFERELTRGKAYELFAVVCEGSYQDIAEGRYRSEMKPQAVLQSIVAFQVRYGVNFIMAGTRQAAEYLTFSLLEKFQREIEERWKALERGREKGAAPCHDPGAS